MSDTAKRALRTFVQGFLGVLALIAVPALNDLVTSVGDGGRVVIDVDLWRGIAIAAVAGGVIAVIAWGQNALEQSTGKTVLPK